MKKVLITIITMLLPLLGYADAVNVDGIYYNLNSESNGAVVASSPDKYKGDIVLPDEINIIGQNFSVTGIADDAFNDCPELTSVNIPISVNTIPAGAFSGCENLTSIIVADGNMFYDSRYNCNAVIETRSNTLIAGCKASKIPYGVQKIIGAFHNCKGLVSIDIPNTVTSIHNAFSGCTDLVSVILPNNLIAIGESSFSGCSSLSSIDIPKSVTAIDLFAFANCTGLLSLTIPNGVTHISNNAFEGCKSIQKVSLPNSLNNIGSWAFAWFHSLTKVSIPNSIAEIKDDTFYFCINLESVVIPNSVKKIGSAFDGCTKLKDVYCFAEEVPEAANRSFFVSIVDNNPTLHVPAKSVDKYKNANKWREFSNIVALTDEEINEYNKNNPAIEVIDIKPGIEGIYQTQADGYRLYNGNNVKYNNTYEIRIEENGDGTFYVDDLLGGWYCQRAGYGRNYAMTGDISISTDGAVSLIDSHVEGWGDGLLSLTGIYDENNLSFKIEAEYVSGMKFFQTWIKTGQIIDIEGINYVIGDNHNVSVFEKKDGYKGDIVVPQEISIGDVTYSVSSVSKAFSGCNGLTSVNIPISINNLDGAFSGCSGLTSLIIPNSVTSIENAFYGCNSLSNVNIPNSIYIIGGAFQDCESLKTVTFPSNLVSIDKFAFAYCSSLTDLMLPDSLVIIGESCFLGCNSLKSLTIPRTVLYIDPTSFDECESLETINVDNANVKYDSRDNCNAIIETYTNKLVLGCKSTIIPQDIITIGKEAFAGSVLKSFNLPPNINIIEESAFANCKVLAEMVIGQNVEMIGNGAFYNCKELKDVYCYALNVPQTSENAFNDDNFDFPYVGNATLHVPAASLEAYKQAIPWSRFGKIVALTEDDPKPTGVNSIKAVENAIPTSIYSIDGKRLASPRRGLNIIRMSDGTTKKMMVK